MCCSIYSLTEMAGWRVLKGIFGGKVGGGSYNRCSQAWEEFGLNMNWSITAEFRLIDCEVFPINQTYLGFETRSLWWWLMARARAGNKTFYARLEVSQKSIDPSQPIEVVRTHIVIWYLHILLQRLVTKYLQFTSYAKNPRSLAHLSMSCPSWRRGFDQKLTRGW